MLTESQHFVRVPKAPLADIQPLRLLAIANHVLWVERGIPWLDMQVAEYNIGDIGREL